MQIFPVDLSEVALGCMLLFVWCIYSSRHHMYFLPLTIVSLWFFRVGGGQWEACVKSNVLAIVIY